MFCESLARERRRTLPCDHATRRVIDREDEFHRSSRHLCSDSRESRDLAVNVKQPIPHSSGRNEGPNRKPRTGIPAVAIYHARVVSPDLGQCPLMRVAGTGSEIPAAFYGVHTMFATTHRVTCPLFLALFRLRRRRLLREVKAIFHGYMVMHVPCRRAHLVRGAGAGPSVRDARCRASSPAAIPPNLLLLMPPGPVQWISVRAVQNAE